MCFFMFSSGMQHFMRKKEILMNISPLEKCMLIKGDDPTYDRTYMCYYNAINKFHSTITMG